MEFPVKIEIELFAIENIFYEFPGIILKHYRFLGKNVSFKCWNFIKFLDFLGM